MANFCGGIKLGDTLKVDNGIITMSDLVADESNVVTPCGMLFDGAVFEVVRVDGVPVLTSVGVDENMDIQVLLRSNCGFKMDGNYFTLNADKSVDFDESHVLEVIYGDANTPVEPIAGTTNMFKLTEADETYTISVSKDDYTSQEQQITADQNHIVEFTLVAAGG